MQGRLVYVNGNHHVITACFGPKKRAGFEVYKNGASCSHRVAVVDYSGDKGFQMAKEIADRRESD